MDRPPVRFLKFDLITKLEAYFSLLTFACLINNFYYTISDQYLYEMA